MRVPAVALCVLALPLYGAVIGVSKPAESLTPARIARLPPAQQAAWMTYLERSEKQVIADHEALRLERAGLTGPVGLRVSAKEGFGARSMPVDKDAAFYRTAEAVRLAETILSFQIPNGGWSKNLDMAQPPRQAGQGYTPNNLSRFPGPEDFDAPRDPDWNYVGTLDNDATNTELRFLVRMSAAWPGREGDRYRASFLRGLSYLLQAQFPNGGWPQVWPLEGGYHDAITFNDNAVTESASLLREVAGGGVEFVPAAVRNHAEAASERAVGCVLRTQVVIAGKPTAWAQQHDALTLAPVAGRNFEPAALSAGESADVLIFLMSLPEPTAPVRAAVENGVAWLKVHAIYGESWTGGRTTPPGSGNPAGGRHLQAAPGAGPIWPRYISLTTGKAAFGDRDKTIHDDVLELSEERRNGYAWYSGGPAEALVRYAEWKRVPR